MPVDIMFHACNDKFLNKSSDSQAPGGICSLNCGGGKLPCPVTEFGQCSSNISQNDMGGATPIVRSTRRTWVRLQPSCKQENDWSLHFLGWSTRILLKHGNVRRFWFDAHVDRILLWERALCVLTSPQEMTDRPLPVSSLG
jgi:hypothetical protein